ncbi:MAG: hypothetical protein MUE46_16275 [Xanthomonadales bacterium]|jgi:hypothetical protein|nr:hypothetical protein [Xanthomonadales bacterium]
MKPLRLPLAIALATGTLVCSPTLHAEEEARSPHKFKGNVELEFRTNTDINVAPASTASFDYATFADFARAEAKMEEDEEDEEDDDDDDDDEEDDDDFDDDDFDDDFDLAGIEDTDLSEEDFDFLTDDDDGDGEEDDPDDDGDDDNDGDTGSIDKRSAAPDHELENLVNQSVSDKVTTRRTKANRSALKFGFSHKYEISKTMAWGSSFRAASDFNNGRSSLDKTNLAVSTGPEFAWKKKGFKMKPAMSFVQIRQDGNSVVSTWVATMAAAYDVSKVFSVNAVYNYQDKDVTDPDSPDAVINTLTFGAEWTVSKQDIIKAKVSPRIEDSSLVTKNKDTSGWELTYSRKLPYEIILGFAVKDDSVDYKNLAVRREDDIRTYGVELTKAWGKRFESALSWESRELDSNLNAKDAKNRSLVVSVNYKF